jgi:alpha-beta hydrolase superfamily lysophospholipase
MVGGTAAVLVVVAACLGTSAYVGWRMTHPARAYATTTPASAGLAYASITFPSRTDHIRLSGWFIPALGSTRTVIVAHGYAQYRLHESASLPVATVLVQHGFNVLTFDFRGCGDSDGNRVTLGQDEPDDLLGAVDWLRHHFQGGSVSIGVLGFSLGATTALEAAARDQADIHAVAADSAFSQLYPYVRNHADTWTNLPAFPFNALITWITPLLEGMHPNRVDALAAVRQLPHTALLFIAGTADTTISDANSQELYAAAASPRKALWLVPGGTHAASYDRQPQAYTQRVLSFFERNL